MGMTRRAARRKAHRERVRRPPWFERLRVMAEYGSSGIWLIGQVSFFRHSMLGYDSLRVPKELETRFERWIRVYEEAYEAPEAFDCNAFNAEGWELAGALKAYVGPTTYVEFQSETPEGGLNPAVEIT